MVFAINHKSGYHAVWKTMVTQEDMKFLKEERSKRHIALFSTKFYEKWITRISPLVFQTIFSVRDTESLTAYFTKMEKELLHLDYFAPAAVTDMLRALTFSFNKQIKLRNDFAWIEDFLLEQGILCVCKQGFFKTDGICPT